MKTNRFVTFPLSLSLSLKDCSTRSLPSENAVQMKFFEGIFIAVIVCTDQLLVDVKKQNSFHFIMLK